MANFHTIGVLGKKLLSTQKNRSCTALSLRSSKWLASQISNRKALNLSATEGRCGVKTLSNIRRKGRQDNDECSQECEQECSNDDWGSGQKRPARDHLDITFNDHIAAFKSKTNAELVRAYFVYSIYGISYLVENNLKIMNLTKEIFGAPIFVMVMKATFYGHFIAGEDERSIMPTLDRIRSFGVKPMLDYSVEEDLTKDEAVEREVKASVSSKGEEDLDEDCKKYRPNKEFADRREKVSSARTYFYESEGNCDKNADVFIRCIEAIADYENNATPRATAEGATFGIGMAAIKMTALGRPQLLLQISEVIERTRKYMSELVGGSRDNIASHKKTIQDMEQYYSDFPNNKEIMNFLKNTQHDEKGIINLFSWSNVMDENSGLSKTFRVPDPKTGRMRRLISQISEEEERMFHNMIKRIDRVVKRAAELDVRVIIDAEQTYFQPAISRMTLEMMRKYNKTKATVFSTYQNYLKNARKELLIDIEQAVRQNFCFGAKFVRGAYMEQERERAQAMGYEDPINPDFEATTAMFHGNVVEVLKIMKANKDAGQNRLGFMIATHNEDTVRFTIKKMKEIGIEPDDKVICFGQLYGMCDYLTFPMGQSGYSVYKYIPYGPVEEVLPYVSRRAAENKGFLPKIQKEKDLLLTELKRRLLSGQIFYEPKGNYVPV